MLILPKFKAPSKGNSPIDRIGVLTSGGDAPGMNAAIRAVVRTAVANQVEVVGIKRGFRGLLENDIELMSPASVANVLQRGGTILKTDRCPEFLEKSARKRALDLLAREQIQGLVVIGGDGSFRGARALERESKHGLQVVGVPGTIDNDIPGTDDTIGFDTATNTALDAIDRIRDTASSHDRTFVIEVMGHATGFIAVQVGLAGGAESIVVPEIKYRPRDLVKAIERGKRRGKTSSIIVVAEGPKVGLAHQVAQDLTRAGHPPRVCILGHIQRGGTPTAHDRVLASAFGATAVHALLAGKTSGMIGVERGVVSFKRFEEIFRGKRALDQNWFQLAEILAT